MIDLSTNPDGKVTAIWDGHIIVDARRGFYYHGIPLSPPTRQPQPEPEPTEIWRGKKATRLEIRDD